MIIPNIWENKKCSKPPTSWGLAHKSHCMRCRKPAGFPSEHCLFLAKTSSLSTFAKLPHMHGHGSSSRCSRGYFHIPNLSRGIFSGGLWLEQFLFVWTFKGKTWIHQWLITTYITMPIKVAIEFRRNLPILGLRHTYWIGDSVRQCHPKTVVLHFAGVRNQLPPGMHIQEQLSVVNLLRSSQSNVVNPSEPSQMRLIWPLTARLPQPEKLSSASAAAVFKPLTILGPSSHRGDWVHGAATWSHDTSW